MKVYKLVTNSPLRNFNYFIETAPNEVLVVDPLYEKLISSWLEAHQKKLIGIVLTHFHADHVGDADLIRKKFKVPCLAGCHFLGDHKIIDYFLKDNEILTYHNGEIEFLYTPGHTEDHICLLIKQGNKAASLVAMDTIFNAGVGNCKNGGDPKTLYQTIKKLLSRLEDDVVLYPGHDYIENNLRFGLHNCPENAVAKELLAKYELGNFQDETTIGLEKKINVFFMAKTEEEFIKLRKLRDIW